MDDFGWGNPTMSTNYMTSSMWTNCDKFPGSMVECRSSANENVQLLSPAPTSSCFSELVGILAPTTSSATGGLDADMLQYQDAVGSDSTVAAQKSRLLYERFTPINGAKSAGGPTSVDVSCLTEPFPSSSAAKNDEDLSAILHGCENLRNFDCSTNNSSESNRDEVVSQCSSNPESLRARKPRGTAGGGRRRREDCARSGEKDHHLLPGSKKSKSWSAKEAEGFRISFRSAPGHVSDDRGGSELLDREEEEDDGYEPDTEAIAQVKEMIYKAAALRPVSLGTEEAVEKPKRKNVRISSDPQTVAARHRRERISERLRVLQRLVPGGSKMDTASMLDEAANYLKFLKSQVTAMESLGNNIVINNNNSSSSSSRWFDYGAVLATISTTTTTATAPFQLPLSHAFAMQGLCHNPIPVASKRSGKAL